MLPSFSTRSRIDTGALQLCRATTFPAQLAFAEKVAAEKGVTLPEDARTQRGVCSAFLDVNAPKGKGATKPAARKKPAKKAKSKA